MAFFASAGDGNGNTIQPTGQPFGPLAPGQAQIGQPGYVAPTSGPAGLANGYQNPSSNNAATAFDAYSRGQTLNAPFQNAAYRDYQNFGAAAQANGAQGGQLLTQNGGSPGVTTALGGMENNANGNTEGQQNLGIAAQGAQAGANGQLPGQQAQAMATGVNGLGATGDLYGQQRLNSATDLYQQAAEGNAPSAAQIQQQQGIEQGLAQSQAQAASTRGNFGLANAQKGAMAAQTGMAQQGAANGAALRANEMATARAGYAGAAGNMAASQLQGAGQYAQAAGAQAGTQLQGQNQYGQMSAAQAQIEQQAAAANFGSQQANQMTGINYYGGQQSAMQNASNTAAQQSQNAGNYALGVGSNANQQQAITNQNQQAWGGAALAAGGMALTAMSDERAKDNVTPNAASVMAQLDHFKPVGFSYKSTSDTPNGQAADAPQVGVLAQDVERGPAGRMLIRHRPDGAKMLDIPSMTGVLAAGTGALKEKSDAQDARIAHLERLLRAA